MRGEGDVTGGDVSCKVGRDTSTRIHRRGLDSDNAWGMRPYTRQRIETGMGIQADGACCRGEHADTRRRACCTQHASYSIQHIQHIQRIQHYIMQHRADVGTVLSFSLPLSLSLALPLSLSLSLPLSLSLSLPLLLNLSLSLTHSLTRSLSCSPVP